MVDFLGQKLVNELLKHCHFFVKLHMLAWFNLLSFDLGHWKCTNWPCNSIHLTCLGSSFFKFYKCLHRYVRLLSFSKDWLSCCRIIKLISIRPNFGHNWVFRPFLITSLSYATWFFVTTFFSCLLFFLLLPIWLGF